LSKTIMIYLSPIQIDQLINQLEAGTKTFNDIIALLAGEKEFIYLDGRKTKEGIPKEIV